MLSLEAATVVPICFIITIGLITSTAKLYEDTKEECRQESVIAIERRDSVESWSFKLIEDKKRNCTRKIFVLNPVKLINTINLINDTVNIFNNSTSIEVVEDLKGIFSDEQ